MRLKRACIYHPSKCITKLDNFNREMQSMADLLWASEAYSEILLLDCDADLDSFDEIWCSCFAKNVNSNTLANLPNRQVLFYICNDPAFFALPPCIADRINFIAYAGTNAEPFRHYWQNKPIIFIKLWQNMFSKMRAKLQYVEDYDYLLGYAGNNRSSWRAKRLRLFTNGLNSVKIIGCAGRPKLTYVHSRLEMQKCLAQLVIGDIEYSSLFPAAHRLLQGLSFSPYCFIDSKLYESFGYDIIDKHFVVSSSDDIANTLVLIKSDRQFATSAYSAFTNLFTELTEL